MSSIQILALLAHVATAEFGVTLPSLDAEVTLKADSIWHLGGFCFGHSNEKKVGVLDVRLDWQGSEALPQESRDSGRAGVYLAAFDGRDHHWGRAKRTWESSSCSEKLRMATSFVHFPGLRSEPKYGFDIVINQVTGTRDWHFALITCGAVEEASMKIEIQGVKGALSIFGANTQFDTSSCPVMPMNWWEQAAVQFSFWALLLCVCTTSGSCVFLIHCRRSKMLGKDMVVGKPCALPENQDIALGHPNVSKVPV